MKLYYHPASTTSRGIMQFCVAEKISYEPVLIDLMKGEQRQEPYASINPMCLVPAIEDDGFVLTESSAILKYIAEKHKSPAYPSDLKQRARINETMDWFNANFYREYGYNMIYPQIFPHHARPSEAANQATIEWGHSRAQKLLRVLNDHILGKGNKFLCGGEPTIADYFGAALITLGELVGNDFSAYPNVDRWLKAMKAMPSWSIVNEVHNGYAASLKGKPFVKIA